MDILDKIKQFVNDSLQSLFVRQKEDFSLIIHKEAISVVSELKTFVSQQVQTNERDMANLQQAVFSLNHEVQDLLTKMVVVQDTIERLKGQQAELSSPEAPTPQSSKPQISIFYAKMIDSTSPLGFKMENLKSSDAGCAFQITLKDDMEGNYVFVDDNEIQQEMLAAFNPLISDSSIYDSVPQDPTQIIVVQPGSVVKEDNLLRIVNKQKIEII